MTGWKTSLRAFTFVATSAAALASGAMAQTGAGAKSPPLTAASADATPQSRALDIGSVVSGTLDEGDPMWPERRYYDAWPLTGRAGSTVTVDLLSDEFDATLYLVQAFQLAWDDDGAGGCSARLQITFPANGTYELIASSYRREATGAYTLRVSDRPGPLSDAPCPGTTEAPPPPNETCVVTRFMQWLSIAAEPEGGPSNPLLEERARTACDLGIETPAGGSWPNGRTARQFDNWYHPNGQVARQFDAWYYPTGRVAKQFDNWYYPSGQVARQFDRWYLPDGRSSSLAEVIEYSLARLEPSRGESLLADYRASEGDWQVLVVITMATEASR